MGRTIKDVKADATEAEIAQADAAWEEQMKFSVTRLRAEEVGGCDACGGNRKDEKYVLCIKAGIPRANNVLLCEFHEGELLKKLMRSWIRRMEGKETVGFCGPLPKDLSAIPGDPIPDPA